MPSMGIGILKMRQKPPQRNHVDAIANTKGVHLTTGVDSDLATISQCVQDPRLARARLFSSIEDMPSSIDIISICTPTATRETGFSQGSIASAQSDYS